jgi:lysophospholipase L1-like esterase
MNHTILCFGDSNTYGTNPVDKSRYDQHQRWPGVLRDQLGEDFWVIEEGQPGRTTVWNDPIEGIKSGKEYLIPCLESHAPLDLVILLLGTNDLKERFSLTATDIALGARTLVQIIQSSPSGIGKIAPQVLLIAPPPVLNIPNLWEPMRNAPETSKRLAAAYQKVASENNCHFLDAGSVIRSSAVDGFHWDIPEHNKLGKEVASQICKIFDTK